MFIVFLTYFYNIFPAVFLGYFSSEVIFLQKDTPSP